MGLKRITMETFFKWSSRFRDRLLISFLFMSWNSYHLATSTAQGEGLFMEKCLLDESGPKIGDVLRITTFRPLPFEGKIITWGMYCEAYGINKFPEKEALDKRVMTRSPYFSHKTEFYVSELRGLYFQLLKQDYPKILSPYMSQETIVKLVEEDRIRHGAPECSLPSFEARVFGVHEEAYPKFVEWLGKKFKGPFNKLIEDNSHFYQLGPLYEEYGKWLEENLNSECQVISSYVKSTNHLKILEEKQNSVWKFAEYMLSQDLYPLSPTENTTEKTMELWRFKQIVHEQRHHFTMRTFNLWLYFKHQQSKLKEKMRYRLHDLAHNFCSFIQECYGDSPAGQRIKWWGINKNVAQVIWEIEEKKNLRSYVLGMKSVTKIDYYRNNQESGNLQKLEPHGGFKQNLNNLYQNCALQFEDQAGPLSDCLKCCCLEVFKAVLEGTFQALLEIALPRGHHRHHPPFEPY